MIFDNLRNLELYLSVHPLLPDIRSFLKSNDLLTIAPVQRYPIAGGAYGFFVEYETTTPENCFIECHKKYIDLQIALSGTEKIGISDISRCEAQPYDENIDLQKLTGDVDYITFRPSDFVIFFPHDGHMPKVLAGADSDMVRKFVIKIPVLNASSR